MIAGRRSEACAESCSGLEGFPATSLADRTAPRRCGRISGLPDLHLRQHRHPQRVSLSANGASRTIMDLVGCKIIGESGANAAVHACGVRPHADDDFCAYSALAARSESWLIRALTGLLKRSFRGRQVHRDQADAFPYRSAGGLRVRQEVRNLAIVGGEALTPPRQDASGTLSRH